MPATKRSKALAGAMAGAALVVALGAAALAGGGDSGPTSSTAAVGAPAVVVDAATPAPEPTADVPATTAAPATTAPAAKATVPSTTPTTLKATPSTAPATTAATTPATTATTAAPAKPAPGVRIEYTTASVQTAMTALHQRIPLFAPTDPQLRTFADAVCASFDQGQTKAQVQATVRDAVSRIQGASLSEADADFAVRTVAQLRCPGYIA
jgi:hypothetical protein